MIQSFRFYLSIILEFQELNFKTFEIWKKFSKTFPIPILFHESQNF